MQYLVSRGQIVSADPPFMITDGQNHNYNVINTDQLYY